MPNAFQELITSESIIIPWHIFSYTCWKQQRQIFQTSSSLLSTKDVHRSLRVEVILRPIHLIHSMAFLVLEGTSFVEHMICAPHGCCHVFRELVLQFFLNPRAETNNLSKKWAFILTDHLLNIRLCVGCYKFLESSPCNHDLSFTEYLIVC